MWFWHLWWYCSQDIGWDCSHLNPWLRLEDPLLRWCTSPLADWWWQLSRGLGTLGCLSAFTTWQLASLRPSDPKESKVEAAVIFKTRSWKSHPVISVICYWLHKSALLSVGQGYMNTRWQDSLGVTWEDAYPSNLTPTPLFFFLSHLTELRSGEVSFCPASHSFNISVFAFLSTLLIPIIHNFLYLFKTPNVVYLWGD